MVQFDSSGQSALGQEAELGSDELIKLGVKSIVSTASGGGTMVQVRLLTSLGTSCMAMIRSQAGAMSQGSTMLTAHRRQD
jgi:hypothetical protein